MPAEKRFKITPAVYLVLTKGDKILLLRRYNTGHHDGEYGLVSGHFEGNETVKQAMAREAREEAGIIISPADLEIVHIMNRYLKENSPGREERLDIFFKADRWQGEPINQEPDKCDELAWFNLDDLPDNVIPCIRQVINCLDKSVLYSEWGWER